MTLLNDVKSDIVNGADLKVEEGHKPTVSRNAMSAHKDGKYVTDAIASGVKNKIFAGPFKKEEVPEGATVNSLQTAPKPNGKVRIILNQSPRVQEITFRLKNRMQLPVPRFSASYSVFKLPILLY